MKHAQKLRTFSDEEQAAWNTWLHGEIAKMASDPESVLMQAILRVCEMHGEALQQQLETDVPAFVTQEIKSLRTELTTEPQQTQQDPKGKSWLTRLITL